MARLTGKDGRAELDGKTWILTGWTYEETSENVQQRAAGDSWIGRKHLAKDYRVEMTGFLAEAAPYTNAVIPVGTEIIFSLKFDAADTDPFATDTGLCTNGRIEHPATDNTTMTAVVESADPSAGPAIVVTG